MITLPDFGNCVEIRQLLAKMGIKGIITPLVDYDPKEFIRQINVSKIITKDNTVQFEKYKNLINSSIDVAYDDFTVGEDGLLEINGIKICIYIKLQYAAYAYKYHLCECDKIREMKSINKGKRYVATSRSDGLFPVIRKDGYLQKNSLEELGLCNYCKNILLSRGMYDENYTLDNFFKKYQPDIKPEYKSERFVKEWEQYAPNWQEISTYYKEQRHYRCQICGVDCSNNRHLLHTHHRDRNKENNLAANLLVLCAYCHSLQAGHERMHEDPEMLENIKAVAFLSEQQGITMLTKESFLT